jgi:CheY-like chemotaxis protein
MSTIVIADDIDADRQFIAQRASRLGLTHELATSGKDALDLVKRSPPRMLIVGTEIGGIRICATLRGVPETAGVQLVLLTPEAQLAATKGWGGKQGVNHYLVKPLQEAPVLELLQPLARSSAPAVRTEAAAPAGDPNDLAYRIAQALAKHLNQPADVAMKLFVNPEIRKVGALSALAKADYNALLQRLSMTIPGADGKNRSAFVDEAKKLR